MSSRVASHQTNLAASLAANDFVLFDLPERFALDIADLRNKWHSLLRQIHPDRFVADSTNAQLLAAQWSSRINEAFKRLGDPLKRAIYLCELRGVPIQAEQNTALPAAFLIQQMQWRESLEASPDLATRATLQAVVSKNSERLFLQCAEALDETGDTRAAAALIRQLMFVQKFQAELATNE